jgi:methionyl-tRNA formyltransferase
VHLAAEALGIAVRTPASLKGAEEQAAMAALDADVAVVAAYGLILPQAVLDAPRRGCLNVHGSILPRWRGAAPVQRAILAGDEETGVTIMQMERGLDTGPMLAKVSTPVDGKTAGALTEELAERGAALMVEVLADLPGHPPVTQPDDGVTYAHKIDKAESRLDFTRAAVDVERQVRAFAGAGRVLRTGWRTLSRAGGGSRGWRGSAGNRAGRCADDRVRHRRASSIDCPARRAAGDGHGGAVARAAVSAGTVLG